MCLFLQLYSEILIFIAKNISKLFIISSQKTDIFFTLSTKAQTFSNNFYQMLSSRKLLIFALFISLKWLDLPLQKNN